MGSHIKKYIFKSMYSRVMRKMRLTSLQFKPSLLLLFLFMLALIYVYGQTKSNDTPNRVPKCEVTSEQKRLLFKLLEQATATLEKLNITYFLCFASLWGAVQESGPLPWDSNAELCILSSNLESHDEASIHRAFQHQNLSLEYKSSDGEYIVRNASFKNLSSMIKLVVFESDSRVGGMFRRVGWKRRLLPPDCDAHQDLQCFPPHLINLPLPKKSFGPLNIPAPRKDIDLLKFHYPNSWWKPLKPRC